MKIETLQMNKYEEIKKLFLDVFSNEPWFDEWEDDNQLNQYLQELTSNNNSLSLVLLDNNNRIVGGSLGYIFNWWQGREYYIKEFFIAREKQSQGLGSIFLEQINNYLKDKDIKAIWLSTQKSIPAYNFYKNNGFGNMDDNVFLSKLIK